MTQYDLNLREYWRIVRRRKWIVIVVPPVFGALAFGMALLQTPPPVYRATASVRFERSFTVTSALLTDMLAFNPVGDLETQAALITGFPVLSRAAQKLGLIPREVAPAEIRHSPAVLEALSTLRGELEVRVVPGTSLIEITATSPEPEKAARLANSVAEAFQEDNRATRSQQVVEARSFIERQLEEVGRRLATSEERLRAFQVSNKTLLLPDEARAALQRLAAQEAEHELIKREIGATEVQLRLLGRGSEAARPPSAVPDGADAALAKLNASLTELALERDNLLLTLRPTHPQVKAVNARMENLRRSLGGALSSRLQVLGARAAAVERVIAGLRAEQAGLPAAALETARLEREVKLNERIFSLLKERLQEALIKEKEQGGEVGIIRPAMASTAPVNPARAGAKGAVGLLIGVVMSLVLAFVVEALDTSIGAIEDVEALLETPVLGVIPHIDVAAELAEEKGEPVDLDKETLEQYAFLISLFAPQSPVAEAFRGLRTNILFSILERDVKALMVASATQLEGKTTVAINLALTLAQLGKKTLLVEADLRNPYIHQAFGVPRDPGLTKVVLGSARLDEVTLGFADLMLGKAGMERLLDSPGMDNFFLLPSGHPPPNPAELLSSHGLSQLLAEARERYDYVIFDSAPILPVADGAILASRVDGVLCVIRVGRVPRAALRRAKVLLEATKSRLLGICLTGVKAEVSPDYEEMGPYHYRYGSRTGEARARGNSRASNGGRWRIPWRVGLVPLALLALGTGVWVWRSGRPAPPRVSTGALPQAVQAPSALSRVAGESGAVERSPVPTPPVSSIDPGAAQTPPLPPASDLRAPAFKIQLHAFRSQRRAEQAVAAYRSRGLEVSVVEAVVPGDGHWWRVEYGAFLSRTEAEVIGQVLLQAGTIEAFTVRRSVPSEP